MFVLSFLHSALRRSRANRQARKLSAWERALARKATYRPLLETLESREVPGSLLSLGIPGAAGVVAAPPAGGQGSSGVASTQVTVRTLPALSVVGASTTGARPTGGVSQSKPASSGGNVRLDAATAGGVFVDPLTGDSPSAVNRNSAGTSSSEAARPVQDSGSSGIAAPSQGTGAATLAAPVSTATGLPGLLLNQGSTSTPTGGTQGVTHTGTGRAPVQATPTVTLTVASAVLRTQAQMNNMELATGAKSAAPPANGADLINRPTLDSATYQALKSAANQAVQGSKGNSPGVTFQNFVAPAVRVNFAGTNATETGGWTPPDTHGAIGGTQFVEVTNDHIDVWSRTGVRQNGPIVSGLHTGVSLNSFFGYSTEANFDPRANYDSTWKRWTVTADAFAESTTLQRFFVAVSQTGSATGAWWIYNFNVTFHTSDFWDYPQLGYDQDALLFTANIFNNGFQGADAFGVAKALMYNGLGFSVPVFQGLAGTLAPPRVIDQNANSYFIAAQPGNNVFNLYDMTNSSHPGSTAMAAMPNVATGQYNVPPSAPQPGTSALLDTLDGRIDNATTQSGTSLWVVHTDVIAGFAGPKFFQINPATSAITQSGFFFASGSSQDWNASITANASNVAFVTWTSDDTPAGINAQVRASGRKSTDPAGSMNGPGVSLVTSPSFYGTSGTQRWGDYSAVTIDPNPGNAGAWVVNESIIDANTWDTRIGKVGY